MQYGISENGLKKICVRLNVPYPPRGYWAKLGAGKSVRKAPLPQPLVGTREGRSLEVRRRLPAKAVQRVGTAAPGDRRLDHPARA